MIETPGLRAIVTGGSRGIGEAIVRALHAAGAAVAFTYRDAGDRAERIANELGMGVFAQRCDLVEWRSLPNVLEQCVARLGGLDVLVNNAGVFEENPFDGDDFERWHRGWERTFAVNLFGAADLAWAAMRAMRAQPPDARGVRGRIVNVASRAAHRGELSFADYGASKAALVNLTKSIARGCARDGIVAFAVAPGFIETDMAAADLAVRRAEIEAEIPARRVGAPAEVASIVAFLASGGADYASGTTVDVNGASYVR
ncbi:MAG: SDR family oxidoreductase [Candidatus Eremiobacteraeota bacterium]|nr:SDR family oxidoreductase [Candidatus Eremiobacteraeota bacterium]